MAKKRKGLLQRFLDRYAAVRIGSSFAILDKETAAEGQPFMTERTFESINKHMPRVNECLVTSLWARDPTREVYDKGVTFDPSGQHKKGVYNLWQGFPIEPIEGDCSAITKFLWQDICDKDADGFQYLMTFFTHLIQFPGDKPGVALVLKGLKGVGKDTTILLLRTLVGTHFAYATSTENILGNFNIQLAQALVVHLEDATWGGDPRAAKKLQGLITSETLRVEPKGIDAYTTPNFARLLLSTNDEWAVPASGGDERRYAVIQMPDHWADGSHRDKLWLDDKIQYFGRLYSAFENPKVLSAWMFYLLSWQREDGMDLKTAVRNPPRNAALAEQKASGFSGLDGFWFDLLIAGELPCQEEWTETGVDFSTSELRDQFHKWLRGRRGEGNPPSMKSLGKRLKKIAPSVVRARETSGARGYYYQLPAITLAREEFAQAHGISFDHLYDEEAQTDRDLSQLI